MRSPLVVLASIALAACGGAAAPAETPAKPAPSASPSATPDDGVFRPITQAQLQVGHYASPDGMVGLVIDRTGPKPKIRMDGDKDIVELTPEEDRFAGELRGHNLRAPDNTIRLYITKGGGIRTWKGRDEVWLTSDKPAEPLGKATIAGEPVKPKPVYEDLVARLTAIAVRTKMPDMKPEDSARIDKIALAVDKATADMFVRYEKHEGTWLPGEHVTPESVRGMGFGGVAHKTDDAWDKNAKGLAKWGGKAWGFSEYGSRGNHLWVMHREGYPPKLAEHTPGLVWEVDGTRAVFVALDGGRYEVDLSSGDKGTSLDAGAGPVASWPAPIQHALLGFDEVTRLANAGGVPQKAADDAMALDDEWNKCAQKTWKQAERLVDTGKMNEAVRKDWVKKVETTCAKSIKALDASLTATIEERVKLRTELFEKAKAKAVALGAAK
jgi:hypothetical protein